MNHDQYSTGPFSRVCFVHTLRDGLQTYTYRNGRLQPSRTLVATLHPTCDDRYGPRFMDVFVNTEQLRSVE